MRRKYLIIILSLSLLFNVFLLPLLVNEYLRFTYSQTLAHWRSKFIPPNSVFLGDSITAGGRGFNRSGDINRGSNGLLTYQIAAGITAAEIYSPRHIVVTAGTNDAIKGRIDVAEHKALWPKICADPKVIITLAPPTAILELNQRLAQVNQIARGACKGHPIISLDTLRGSDGLIQSRYTVDGVHLSAPAYVIWRSLLAEKGV